MADTVAVAVTFTLNSTAIANTPPYNITGCSGLVTYSDNTSAPINGWDAEAIGTPQPNGASFSLNVNDAGYSSTNQTSIGNWALTCIPRSPTTQASPFTSNSNTITGNGATGSNGNFSLNFSNPVPKIKNAGDWDWSLMVQINLPGGVIHCYGSDPEMDVSS